MSVGQIYESNTGVSIIDLPVNGVVYIYLFLSNFSYLDQDNLSTSVYLVDL